MQTWAAIFDWDGVIIDSSRRHETAWQMMAREEGRELPPTYFRRSFGMKNEQAIAELLGWTRDPAELSRLSLRKEEIFREELHRQPSAPLPGVIRFLAELKQAGVPCVIASSTPRLNIDCVIDTLGLRSNFKAMICSEDVSQGKPHPEVFLLAAREAGARADRCVVFEDAQVGIEAARAAGMRVVAVATTHPADTLRRADLVVERLDRLELGQVQAWFESGGGGAAG
jgi:beta-phosphoglucomutase family hydrolase